MKYKEQDLQIKCVKWFRIQYPAFAKLLFHPKNEGTKAGERRIGGIAKAEGVVAGVADLILSLPSMIPQQKFDLRGSQFFDFYIALAIEMKTEKGRQSAEQKQWQCYFEEAGGKYVIARSFDEFMDAANDYLKHLPNHIESGLQNVYRMIIQEEDEAAKRRLKQLINKKK